MLDPITGEDIYELIESMVELLSMIDRSNDRTNELRKIVFKLANKVVELESRIKELEECL